LPDAARLSETLRRLDALIEETGDPERMRSGLGMRLALSLALETREGKAPGSDTSALVAGWVERYGREAVDRAVSVARVFLTQPGELAEKLRKRLVPGGEG
jgi:hypothetical protein